MNPTVTPVYLVSFANEIAYSQIAPSQIPKYKKVEDHRDHGYDSLLYSPYHQPSEKLNEPHTLGGIVVLEPQGLGSELWKVNIGV